MPLVLERSHLPLAALILGSAIVFAWRAPWTTTTASDLSNAPAASNVAMNCAPGQQAAVRQSVVSGELRVSVNCLDSFGEAVSSPMVQPAVALRPVSYVTAPALTPAVVAPATRTTSAPVAAARRAPESGRSWKKTALVIGSAAGGGAGIGALAGGKKGALIGAAIGGGGATLYEVLKDR